MGWDTQINILVEQCAENEKAIARDLFESDAKSYWGNGAHFAKYKINSQENNTLFFTYERRKYLPYWSIQEVSAKYSDCYITVVASSPDFICGPAGLVRILNGNIIDSYGFFERFGNIDRLLQILENPDPEILLQLFGKEGIEARLRQQYLEVQPQKWVDEKYFDNMINFSETQQAEMWACVSREYAADWYEIALK